MTPQQFNDLADPLPEAMCLIAREGRIVAANTAMTEMLGMCRQSLVGAPLKSLVADPDEQAGKSEKYLQTCLRSRTLIPGVIKWCKGDGQFLDCRCEGAVVPPSSESPALQVLLRCIPKEEASSQFSLLNDEVERLRRSNHEVMNQRAQLESIVEERTAKLTRKTHELEQFAYVASHDLKAPLRAIANLSEWVEEDLEACLTPGTRKQMALLRGRVHRMEALIEGILQYSRVGRASVEVVEVDVSALLVETIDSLAPPPGFNIEVTADMPLFKTARVPLSQVFANLLSNAIKYRERDDGWVKVSVQEVGDYFQFKVVDDGPGIAELFHEKVFQIFQTLQARDTVESTGIGLTLVKKIVEEQGGVIELESTEGEGSTFRFTWPKQPVKNDDA